MTVEQDTTTEHWGLPLAVLIVGMFMSVLDVTIVNVAIPTIKNDFGVSLEDVQWVATAYTLTLGVVVPISSWLSDKVGLKRLYLLSLLGFAIGSGLCGLATGLGTLVAYRIVQAVAGGILPVVTMSIIYRIVPRRSIGMAMSMYGLGVVVAPAVGPTLGGYLVEYVDWRLIFFVNVPVGVLGWIAAAAQLPALPGKEVGRFDLWGFVTIGTGLFTLLLAVTEGPDWGWGSYGIQMLFIVSATCLALFVVIELTVESPLLDLRIFRYWPFTNSLLLISVLSIGLTAVLFYVPQLLQSYQGLGAFESGLVLMPSALAMAVMMPVAGRLYDRLGARWPATAGLAILAYGTYLLGQITLDTPHATITWLQTLRSVGLGLAMMPIITGGTSAVPPAKVSDASALNNVVQRVAGAMGVAALTAMLDTSQSQLLADRAGMTVPETFALSGVPRTGETELALYQKLQSETFVSAMDQQ
ncbi:MAG: DHA2 family efflux MFS transporter permease subunit, partial [Nonomuraea sp.]|nr:DHA2 family efflux MFS transporter permease subunit [Nonomuraea sp.]